MDKQTIRSVIADFATKINAPSLAFDDDGFCSIGFDDLIVNLELGEAGLALYVWLGEVPEPRRGAVALRLADANYLFSGTQGATLGMNRLSGDVVLSVSIDGHGLTLARFERVMENLLNIAEAWQRRLAGGDEAPAPAAAPGLDPAAFANAVRI